MTQHADEPEPYERPAYGAASAQQPPDDEPGAGDSPGDRAEPADAAPAQDAAPPADAVAPPNLTPPDWNQYPRYPAVPDRHYGADTDYPDGGYGYERGQEPRYPDPQSPYQQPQAPLRPDLVNPFVEQSNTIPRSGMRRVVYKATFGTVNLGPSAEEQAARARRERVRRPLHGSWRVVVMSIKGGVGKTTTAAMAGRTLAEWRGDRVVALDTNPDMGTLGDRLVGSTDVTVRGLLAHEAQRPITQVAEVNRFTNLAGRLHVLANEQDPAVSEDFSGEEYARTLSILERFYNVIIADCGTGVLRPWVRDMLALANTLVVVAEPKGDAATRAAGTLDWIEQHGFGDLVARSIAVINYRSPTPKSLDVDALTSFFAQRCRAVCKIRYDEHLDLGVKIQYEPIPDAPPEAYVADTTKEDYLELAATIADEFR
jgi:MinD-like ATPase involved in chromosome partitioning or flagellar assembly